MHAAVRELVSILAEEVVHHHVVEWKKQSEQQWHILVCIERPDLNRLRDEFRVRFSEECKIRWRDR